MCNTPPLGLRHHLGCLGVVTPQIITLLSVPSSDHAVFTDDSEQSNTSVESEDEDLIKLKKAIQEHLAKEDKFKVIILLFTNI